MTNPTLKSIADQEITLEDLRTPNNLIEKHPETFPASRLRYWLRERDNNGLAECGAVLHRDRRLFIAVPRFLKWLELTT